MPRQFKVISTTRNQEHIVQRLTDKEKLEHMSKVTHAVLQDAQDTWADLWNELEGKVTRGVMILPDAEKGHYRPQCGWPEFLEKMWQLKHCLDYAQRYCKKQK